MKYRKVKWTGKLSGGETALQLTSEDRRLDIVLPFSSARVYGEIMLEEHSKSSISTRSVIELPRATARFELKWPRFLKRILNRPGALEIWSRNQFRRNWTISCILDPTSISDRTLQVKLQLRSRFRGSVYEAAWDVPDEIEIEFGIYREL